MLLLLIQCLLLVLFCVGGFVLSPCSSVIFSFPITLLREKTVSFTLNHIPMVFFYGTYANSANPDQTPQNTASDQGLRYLLTESSIKIRIT